MFDRWLVAGAAPAIESALASIAPARGAPVAVLGDARLARALAARGRAVMLAGAEPKSVKKLPAGVTLVDAIAERSAAALIALGGGERDDWEAAIAGWARSVIDGGGLVMVDRAPAIELSRRALCAGLSALEQRVAGRWIVTSGLVSDL